MREVRVRAPGKVNVQLSVGPTGQDGFHPLATVFQAVNLYETVTATLRDDDQISLTVSAIPALEHAVDAVPLDESNLAWRAAQTVRDQYGLTAGVDLHIHKGVPVAGGMAGGSADAAAALVACARLWDSGATRSELHEMAATLGSDVPFSLQGHTAVGIGRGTELSPAMTRGEYFWVFALQEDGLSTPAVFGEFDRLAAQGAAEVASPQLDPAIMQALSLGDAVALGKALTNDLQEAALSLQPRIQYALDAMHEAGALGAIVSGSGPTVAGLARSRQHALSIGAHLDRVNAAAVTIAAAGPVTGAVILDE